MEKNFGPNDQDRILPAQSQLVLYRTEDDRTRVEVRLQDENVWMTQATMAELYQTTPQNITLYLKAIYKEGELGSQATCKEFLQVQSEEPREVSRNRKFDNLPAIIAVGYRVRSPRGTQFRRLATERLNEYLVKGFTMDDERLKAVRNIGSDYFDELLDWCGKCGSERSNPLPFHPWVPDWADCSGAGSRL